ncbi:hypothetical protein QFC19_006730 [Naganishia cerealis]|uniref:Uncharacterized protein n=1 Tax=Naganishia cerealis TaxID=610337 RepID=A0ACC2VG25_9TREE|nr:hypothetical protein QFC19_006730 [Naganishia cerealis]
MGTSDARPSPASSSSSFSLSAPSTPPESSSPVTEVAVAPEVIQGYSAMSTLPEFGSVNLPGSGPFPVFSNSQHSLDPHGLSRYLMNPEDPILDYMYPVPLRPKAAPPPPAITESTVSTRPQSQSRQPSFSLFGKKSSHGSSPLARSSVLKSQNVFDESQAEVEADLVEATETAEMSAEEDVGSLNTPTLTNRSMSAKPSGVAKPALSIATSIPMSSRSVSLDSLENRMASSESSLVSNSTDSTDEMKTPVIESESLPPVLHVSTGQEAGETVEPILDSSKERTPTAAVKRPGLISGSWKTWLGVHKSDKTKKEKLQVKKPKNLLPAPEISIALSVDPLSGTLPGSIPPSASTLVEEELHIPEQVSSRELECIKTIHRMTLNKLHAIRAVNSSHPAVVDVVDKVSYQRNLLLNPAIAQLQSPRSSSPMIDVGSCIFPQADIFSIDVRLINILRKLDARKFDDTQIQEIKHLKMSAVQSRMEKEKRWSQIARSRSDDQSGIGIARFVERPCFEDRMVDYDSEMQPRKVRTARGLAMWEPEFTKQTEGWVELAQQNLLKRAEWLGQYPSSQSSPLQPASRLQSSISSEDLASTTTVSPKRRNDFSVVNTRLSPPVRKTIARPPSTIDLWAPTRQKDRRQEPSDTEEDDSEEEESDDSDLDDLPLSNFRNSSRPVSNVLQSAPRANRSSHLSQMLSRPPSMMFPVTKPQPLEGPNVTTTVQPLQTKRGSTQDSDKYREEYLKVRNRIEKSRKGETERERMSQAIRERTKSATHSATPASGAYARQEFAKDLRVDSMNKGPSAGSASAPTSPRRHSRNLSYSSALPSAVSVAKKSHRPTGDTRPSAQALPGTRSSQYASGNSLTRRSMSYADVGNSGNYMYGMPNIAPPVMFVPVPMMPFAPMVNPFGMPMQTTTPQMMMMSQLQQQQQQQQRQRPERPRRQSAMELTNTASSGQKQHPERSTLPRGGSRGRIDGRDPVR